MVRILRYIKGAHRKVLDYTEIGHLDTVAYLHMQMQMKQEVHLKDGPQLEWILCSYWRQFNFMENKMQNIVSRSTMSLIGDN